MPSVTVVIPFAPYHADIVQRAVNSVITQTVPCFVEVIEDTYSRGTGWARNQGLAKAQTEHVVFLDADDWIASTFVEKCLTAYQPGKYVYTDWFEDTSIKRAPDCPWKYPEWHVVTTLLETDAARRVGGFDESLPGAEDAYFYYALKRAKVCGIAVHEPLFFYGRTGLSRSKQLLDSGQYTKVIQQLAERYTMAGCCGDNLPDEPAPVAGEGQEGFVLVQSLWMGNRTQRGWATGIVYGRTGNGKQLLIHPADLEKMPHLFRAVPVHKPAIPLAGNGNGQPGKEPPHGIAAIANALNAARGSEAVTLVPMTLAEIEAVPVAEKHVSGAKVAALAKRGRPKKG